MWRDAWLGRDRGDHAAWKYSDKEDDCGMKLEIPIVEDQVDVRTFKAMKE